MYRGGSLTYTRGAPVYFEDEQGRRTTGDETRDAAVRTVDHAFRSGLLPDHAAERASALVDAGSLPERSLAARWAIAAGAGEYRTAFAKLLVDPVRGHLLWTPRKADAYRAVAAVQEDLNAAESRTALTTSNTSALILLTLDPAIMLTSDGSNDPLRRLATGKRTLTNFVEGSELGRRHERMEDGGLRGGERVPHHRRRGYVSRAG